VGITTTTPTPVDLRRQLYPTRDHDPSSQLGHRPGWPHDIPGDPRGWRSSMSDYGTLTEKNVLRCCVHIVDHFPSVTAVRRVQPVGSIRQWTNTVVRRSGADAAVGIKGPDDIVRRCRGAAAAWVSAIDYD